MVIPHPDDGARRKDKAVAKKIQDQFTTTANVDAVRAQYGDDDTAVFGFDCGRCGGPGVIPSYRHVEGGVCFECGGNGGHYTKTVGQLVAAAKRRDTAAANKARKAAATAAKLDAWKADNADLLARADATGCDWYQNWRYAPDAFQVANLTDAVAEREARNAKEAARKADAQPVPTGKTAITGTVVSWKEVQNTFSYYAETILKVVVEDQRGFRVFGTCPAKLADAAYDAFYADRDRSLDGSDVWKNEALKGAMVTFTATVEQSKDDPAFGFFKRATKASLLDGTED